MDCYNCVSYFSVDLDGGGERLYVKKSSKVDTKWYDKGGEEIVEQSDIDALFAATDGRNGMSLPQLYIFLGGSGGSGGGTSDYELLNNLPQIDGVTLIGNKTLAEIGVPTKTSDLTNDSGFVTDTELDEKVDKEAGKGLSSNDYTDAEKTKLAGLSNFDDTAILASLANKVDKEAGKGLSSNDYTDAEKTKLTGIEAGAEANVIEVVKVNGTALTPDGNKAVDVIVPTYSLVESSPSKYEFKVNGTTTTTIDIPKDLFLEEADVVELSGDPDLDDGKYIKMTLSNGKNLYINIADLVDPYTSGNGIDISSSNEISAKIDTAKANGLGLTSNGIKLDAATDTSAGAMSASDKSKLDAVEDNAEANVQSDWNQTDTSADDFIKNKPALSTVATSGDYDDLTNKPALSTVATSGDYDDLTNKPTLSTVATSGDYADLSNTPTLSTVATSGDYDDLSNTPALSTVATSGDYDDLTNKPTIPAPYTLPIATESSLGGVKAVSKTSSYDLEIAVDDDGKLWGKAAASASPGSLTIDVDGEQTVYNGSEDKSVTITTPEVPIETVKVNGTALTPDTDKAVNITLPTVPIETVKVNGTALTPDGSKAVDITVPAIPTNISSFTNDSGYLTMTTLPTADSYTLAVATTTEGYSKSYEMLKNGTAVGVKIDIPKDMVVKSGSIVDDPSGQPAGKYIELVLNDTANTKIYIPVSSLVDAYTGGNGVNVSSENKISVKIDSAKANGLSVSADGVGLDVATTSNAGAMSASDKTKLDGLSNKTVTSTDGTVDVTTSASGYDLSVAEATKKAFLNYDDSIHTFINPPSEGPYKFVKNSLEDGNMPVIICENVYEGGVTKAYYTFDRVENDGAYEAYIFSCTYEGIRREYKLSSADMLEIYSTAQVAINYENVTFGYTFFGKQYYEGITIDDSDDSSVLVNKEYVDSTSVKGIQVNGSDITLDSDRKANITVPKKVSDLTNDSGFLTSFTETDPVFTASAAYGISATDITKWNNITPYDDTSIRELIAKKPDVVAVSTKLSADDWSSKELTLTIADIDDANAPSGMDVMIECAPAVGSYDAYVDNKVMVKSADATAHTITFQCNEEPTEDVSVVIKITKFVTKKVQ